MFLLFYCTGYPLPRIGTQIANNKPPHLDVMVSYGNKYSKYLVPKLCN